VTQSLSLDVKDFSPLSLLRGNTACRYLYLQKTLFAWLPAGEIWQISQRVFDFSSRLPRPRLSVGRTRRSEGVVGEVNPAEKACRRELDATAAPRHVTWQADSSTLLAPRPGWPASATGIPPPHFPPPPPLSTDIKPSINDSVCSRSAAARRDGKSLSVRPGVSPVQRRTPMAARKRYIFIVYDYTSETLRTVPSVSRAPVISLSRQLYSVARQSCTYTSTSR